MQSGKCSLYYMGFDVPRPHDYQKFIHISASGTEINLKLNSLRLRAGSFTPEHRSFRSRLHRTFDLGARPQASKYGFPVNAHAEDISSASLWTAPICRSFVAPRAGRDCSVCLGGGRGRDELD